MAKRRKKTQERAETIVARNPLDPRAEYDGSPVEYYLHGFFSFVRNNFKEVLLFVLAVSIIIIGLAFLNYRTQRKELKSLIAYERLMQEPLMKENTGAELKAAEKLEKYAKRWSVSEKAQLRSELARISYLSIAGKYDQAALLSRKVAGRLKYPEVRAFFHMKAAIFFENSSRYKDALGEYRFAGKLIQADNFFKAYAVFGEGRCLYLIGKKTEGEKLIKSVISMKNKDGIDSLRGKAIAFLLAPRTE